MDDHQINLDAQRAICWTCFIIMTFVLYLQVRITGGWHIQNGHNIFYWTLLGLYLVHALHVISHLCRSYAWPVCSACLGWRIYGSVFFVLSRVITYSFMLQRTKLTQIMYDAQDIEPILSPRCFKVYFPMILFFLWIAFTFGAVDHDANMVNARCRTLGNGRSYCEYLVGPVSLSSVTPLIGPLVEVIFTLVLL